MTSGLIVECFGLPGAGKTTLVTGLAADADALELPMLKHRPLRYRGRHKLVRVGMNLYFHLRRPMSTVSAYRVALQGGDDRVAMARQVPALMVYTYRMEHAVRQIPAGQLIILEQGVLQQLRSLLASNGRADNRSVKNFIEHAERSLKGTPWLVLSIDVDARTAGTRIADRQPVDGRFDRMFEESRVEALELEAAAQRRIEQLMAGRQGVTVAQLGADGSVEALRTSAASVIRRVAAV